MKDLGPEGTGVVFGAPAPPTTATATAGTSDASEAGPSDASSAVATLPAVEVGEVGEGGGAGGVAPPPIPASTQHSPAKAPGEAEVPPTTPFTAHPGGIAGRHC